MRIFSLDNQITLETESLFLGTFLPYAELEIAGERKCIYGERAENVPGIILRTQVQHTDERVVLSQTLENCSDQAVFFIKSGFKTVKPLRFLRGTPDEWVLNSLHGEMDGTDLATPHLSANEKTIQAYASFGVPLTEDLPQDERHNDGGWRLFEETVTLYTDGDQAGVLLAPVNEPQAFLQYEFYVKPDAITMDFFSDMSFVRVEKGESRSAQDVMIFDGPFERAAAFLIRNYQTFLGERTDRPAPWGWCSWYSVFEHVTEKDVLSAVEFFERHQNEFLPDYIQIDDGYQKTMGDWSENAKFPSGLKACAKRIRRMGVQAGIWLAPTYLHETSDACREHPEWIARNAEGNPATKLGNWGGLSYGMDVTRPEVQSFIGAILREKKNEGFNYFKIDFNRIYTCGKTSYDPAKTSLQAFRELYAFYRKTLGEDCYLLSCTGMMTRGTIGYADASRTGTDTPKCWMDRSCTVYYGLRQNPVKAIANGILYACDPDVSHLMGEPEKLSESQRRIWHSFVGIFGGVTQVSELAADMEAHLDQLEILTPPCVERAKPVYPCTDPDNTRIGFNAHRVFGNFGVYLLWNPKENSCFRTRLSATLSDLGEKFHVFSFWDRSYLGVQSGDFLLRDFPQFDMKLLRFTPVSAEKIPVLIGSTFHLSVGANEIEKVCADKKQVHLVIKRVSAACGSVYFYSENELKLRTCDHCQANVYYRDRVAEVQIKWNPNENVADVLMDILK